MLSRSVALSGSLTSDSIAIAERVGQLQARGALRAPSGSEDGADDAVRGLPTQRLVGDAARDSAVVHVRRWHASGAAKEQSRRDVPRDRPTRPGWRQRPWTSDATVGSGLGSGTRRCPGSGSGSGSHPGRGPSGSGARSGTTGRVGAGSEPLAGRSLCSAGRAGGRPRHLSAAAAASEGAGRPHGCAAREPAAGPGRAPAASLSGGRGAAPRPGEAG